MAVNPDQTWHSPLLCIWSAVEMNVAILCSCAPTLRCLIQRFWPKLLDSIMSTAQRSNHQTQDSAAPAAGSNATTTASTTTTTSAQSITKKTEIVSQVEITTPQQEETEKSSPAVGLLALRRSLFKPFAGAANTSLASCYGGERRTDEEQVEAQRGVGSGAAADADVEKAEAQRFF